MPTGLFGLAENSASILNPAREMYRPEAILTVQHEVIGAVLMLLVLLVLESG